MGTTLDLDDVAATSETAKAELADLHKQIGDLRATMVDLLEILRQWEPDHASGEDRRRILMAMYQVGILRDPTATVAAMQTPNAEDGAPPDPGRLG